MELSSELTALLAAKSSLQLVSDRGRSSAAVKVARGCVDS